VIGIALEGGGALGLAHVGVLEWMYDHHVPVDRIAGTSMGALVGALASSGSTPKELEALATSGVFGELFTVKPSLSQLSYRRREDRSEMPGALEFGLKGGLTLGSGLIADGQLNAFLTRELAAYNSSDLKYDDLPIPFRCVSTNLTTLQPKIFDDGSLPFAVRASISIPGVFPPVHLHGDVLIDGATVDNLPVDILRQDLRPDVAISVYLGDSSFPEAEAASLTSVFERALSAGASRNVALTRRLADIEIAPAVTALSVTDFGKADVLIKAGYVAAEAHREQLLRYALNDQDWSAYEADLRARARKPPVLIEKVVLDDPGSLHSKTLLSRAQNLQDKPFRQGKTEALVSDIRGEGALDAYYSTFRVPQQGSQAPASTLTAQPDDGIVIHIRPNRDGPPYLLFGSDIAAENANVTSVLFKARVVDENLGGVGSELRADVFLGYLTRLGTEYYRPIGSKGFFVQPQVAYLREPVYLWLDQKRVSERLLQRAGGGFDFGYTASKNLQMSAMYQASTLRWVLKSGVDDSPTPHASGTTQSVAGHLVFNDRVAEIASPSGASIDLKVGYLMRSVDSREAPFLDLRARQSFRLAGKDLVVLSADADTYFRHDVADPLRFTLGGPLRLSAASIDEYRGTDTVLAQAIALHRIANLPTGLGQGVYLTSGYEAGSVWSPEQRSFLRQDGILGILVNTPIGVITTGGSIGDAGHRKVFFTLGGIHI
jgi:NTE family protein